MNIIKLQKNIVLTKPTFLSYKIYNEQKCSESYTDNVLMFKQIEKMSLFEIKKDKADVLFDFELYILIHACF